jgi:two-component system chemotaxis response regulator CheY
MKILIVDDEILFSRLVKSRLERWGHSVTIMATANEAIERLKKEPFRVVVVDADLPGIGGPKMCRRVRDLERSRYTYVMVYSETNDREKLIPCLEAGADDFLLKPFNPVELKLRLRNAKRLLNLEDELREGGGVDAVTHMVNLASFREFFSLILNEARRSNAVGALMYVGVPDFNPTFNEHGYGPAQTLMAEVARILGRAVRRSDLVSRIDEDQFCVLLQNTYWDKCQPLAEKFSERIENSSVYVEDFEIRPKVTIATTNFPIQDMPADDILQFGERIPFER